MRYNIFFLICVLSMPFTKAFAGYSYYSLLVDQEEPQVSLGKGKFESKTKDAFFSYEQVEERADYFAFKLKNLTFGEYTEQVLYAAPLITGRVEFSIERINFYFDYNNQKSGVKYKIGF